MISGYSGMHPEHSLAALRKVYYVPATFPITCGQMPHFRFN